MVNLADFSEWSASDYLHDYYDVIEQDELETIAFTVSQFKKIQGMPVALELGCGPTLHRAIPLSPYVQELHVADYLESNLRQVRDWIEGRSTAHNWQPFTRYALQCEGIFDPTIAQIDEREKRTRAIIRRYLMADVRQFPPLLGQMQQYPVVVSCYCADSITADRSEWATAMQNIIGTVAPGGFFLTAALRNCQHYRVGDRYFPSANINEIDLQHILIASGITPKSLTIEVASVPTHDETGYNSIILSSGFLGAEPLAE